MENNALYFPRQKVATTQKTKTWYKECLDSALNIVTMRHPDTLEDHRKMQVYEDMYNDIIDEQEIEAVFNPMKIQHAAFPASIKNYPLSVPKIDLLIGEEIKRKFDWSVIGKNEESHSNHSKMMRDEILEYMMQEIQNSGKSEEEIEKDIQEVSKYYKYNFKDLNEITGTRVLQYLWREQNLKAKFSNGFKDVLVKGREIYRIEIVAGEPVVESVDPKNLYFIRKGDSHQIEDADIIIEYKYEPIGKVIDEFHDYLSPIDVGDIESGYDRVRKSSQGGVLNHVHGYPLMLMSTQLGGLPENDEGMLPSGAFGLPYDAEGNVLVVRARWVGRRKIGRLTFFNMETGEEEERLVSENYVPNEELGETVKWFWINEAYKTTRIGDDKYVDMGPSEVQMRHFDNPSKCFLGYVGTDYEKSLMSRMESLQYLFNVYMRRLELVTAKYKGPIYKLSSIKKPAEWTMDMWMYYAEIMGWMVEDDWNEGTEGQSTGKLAGNQQGSQSNVLNAEIGQYVAQLIQMLQYIEQQIGRIAGVTDQREGQVDNRETVGGIERAVTQSSHITERWFFVHDETKKRVMAALLDTAKQAWKNNKSKKIAFIMEDMARVMLSINGEDFSSSEFDLFVSNASEDMEIRQALKQLSQAAVQNGASLTLPITILRSDSITEMAKKIEEEEAQRLAREEQMNQQQIESAERMKQAELQDKQADRDLKYYEIDMKYKEGIEKEYIKLSGDVQEGTEVDDTATEQRKIAIQEKKQALEEKKALQDTQIKQRQLSETERHNKATESIQRSKPRTVSK